jgi:hypothetical protein
MIQFLQEGQFPQVTHTSQRPATRDVHMPYLPQPSEMLTPSFRCPSGSSRLNLIAGIWKIREQRTLAWRECT